MSDRKALIRIASSLPKGSKERRILLSELQKTSFEKSQISSWVHFLRSVAPLKPKGHGVPTPFDASNLPPSIKKSFKPLESLAGEELEGIDDGSTLWFEAIHKKGLYSTGRSDWLTLGSYIGNQSLSKMWSASYKWPGEKGKGFRLAEDQGMGGPNDVPIMYSPGNDFYVYGPADNDDYSEKDFQKGELGKVKDWVRVRKIPKGEMVYGKTAWAVEFLLSWADYEKGLRQEYEVGYFVEETLKQFGLQRQWEVWQRQWAEKLKGVAEAIDYLEDFPDEHMKHPGGQRFYLALVDYLETLRGLGN
mgnify:CR=1 FL=1|jgi:hypothetical protein